MGQAQCTSHGPAQHALCTVLLDKAGGSLAPYQLISIHAAKVNLTAVKQQLVLLGVLALIHKVMFTCDAHIHAVM